jgi:hypothetical protein
MLIRKTNNRSAKPMQSDPVMRPASLRLNLEMPRND